MILSIQSSDELQQLLEALGDEISKANIYHQLFCDLYASIPKHEREMNQSRTFWQLTLDALHEAALSRLCKVYDQESSSLNLVNLLDTIAANLHLFSEVNFRQRLKGNAFVDSLARLNRVPDIAVLKKDIALASCSNPLVRKLNIWRNNLVAHRGVKNTLKKNLHKKHPLPQDEIKQLLKECLDLFNKYSNFFHATTWAKQIIGHDDFKHTLKFVGLGLDKYEADIKKEYRQTSQKIAKAKAAASKLGQLK